MTIGFDLDLRNWITLFKQNNHTVLSQEFIRVLSFFRDHTYTKLDSTLTNRINTIVQSFLHLFSSPDFRVPAEHADAYISLNPVITNLVAMSDFENTDPWLEMILRQEANLLKIAALYSCRNQLDFQPEILFEAHPLVASKWWVTCWSSIESCASPRIHDFFKLHMKRLGQNFQLFGPEASYPYTRIAHIDPSDDLLFKSRFNKMIKETLGRVQITSNSDPKHIAVATSNWFANSVVYQCLNPFIRSLKPEYKLTLIHFGKSREDLETSLFDDVIKLEFQSGSLSITSLQTNTFSLIYYPDLGMNTEAKFLSNLRIAPIQVMGYGYPVSTYGSEIDYFIGGQDVEHPDLAERTFSERLVLIPGMGIQPPHPSYVPDPDITQKEDEKISDQMIINCSWGSREMNYPLLKTLNKIKDSTNKKLLFRFFPGSEIHRMNAFIALKKDLEAFLGADSIDLAPHSDHKTYMNLLSTGHFSIDAFPFGGFHTILDSLMCYLPMITWEGDRSMNRLSSALLRRINLEECVATNEKEYIEKILDLIESESARYSLIEKIKALDFASLKFPDDQTKPFKEAMNIIINKHQNFKNQATKAPIIIE